MRKITCKIIVFIMVLMMSGSAAFSALSSGISFNNTASKTELDGDKRTFSSSFSRNFNLSLSRPVTPIISYSFNLRGNLTDSESADYLSNISSITYKRNVQPTLNLNISNNIYNLNSGYRRKEEWSTAHYTSASRLTSEFYYSRLSLAPQNLPSFSLNLERLKNFDHLSEREYYNTTDSYSVDSSYTLPSESIKLGYNIVFSRDVNRTPLTTRAKSVVANFTNNYNIGYTDVLWNRKIDYSAIYQGNYTRDRNRQYFTAIGSSTIVRANNGGFSTPTPDSDKQAVLSGNSDLTDGNLVTPASIDLTAADNQIGIQMLFGKSADRLYIYVDTNISAENVLDDKTKWQVYMSSDNTYGSWNPVTIGSVNVVYDSLNGKYRYEILFSSSQEAFYFKAVNLLPSGVSDVDVTEIQAYGTDDITSIGADTTVTKSFNQGINLNLGIRPMKKWDVNISYSIDRGDQTPSSITESVSGILGNVLSKSIVNDNVNTLSTVTRTYRAVARWQAHRLLTSVMDIGRNESFTSLGGAGSASNNYNLSMNYVPFSAIYANLSVVRSDSFTNNEKVSTSDSVLLSADTELHRDLNMVTDLGFSRSHTLSTDTTTSVSSLNSSLDARITKKTSGNFKYGYRTTTTGDDSAISKDLSMSLDYQAGRAVDLSGSFDYANSSGNTDISESIGVNWLPLPKIRLNVDYRHSTSDGTPYKTTTDSISGYMSFYITKFASARLSYSYLQTDKGTGIRENSTINSNVNCRF